MRPAMAKATYPQLDGALTWVRRNFPGFVFETALFGFFTFLISLSTYILLHNGLPSRPMRAMLAVTLVMYISSTTYWALDLYPFITILRDPERHGVEHANESFARGLVSAGCLGLNLILSDVVVMWRAWVLWGRSRLVLFSCCVLFMATFVLTVVTGCISKNPSSNELIIGDEFGFPVDTFGLVTLSLSLASNVWATALIGYKAWLYRRNIGAHLHEGGRRRVLEKILTLLVESGAFYCGVWVIYIVSNATSALRGAFAIFVEDGVPQLSGIYPTIIIVIVCLQKSHCERQFTYAHPVLSSLEYSETAFEPSRLDSVILHGNALESTADEGAGELEILQRGREKPVEVA